MMASRAEEMAASAHEPLSISPNATRMVDLKGYNPSVRSVAIFLAGQRRGLDIDEVARGCSLETAGAYSAIAKLERTGAVRKELSSAHRTADGRLKAQYFIQDGVRLRDGPPVEEREPIDESSRDSSFRRRYGPEDQARVLEYLGSHPGESQNKIMLGLGISFYKVQRGLANLVLAGKARPVQVSPHRMVYEAVTPRETDHTEEPLSTMAATGPASEEVPLLLAIPLRYQTACGELPFSGSNGHAPPPRSEGSTLMERLKATAQDAPIIQAKPQQPPLSGNGHIDLPYPGHEPLQTMVPSPLQSTIQVPQTSATSLSDADREDATRPIFSRKPRQPPKPQTESNGGSSGMHKGELIQMHTLLCQVEHWVETRYTGDIDKLFPEYRTMGISPIHVHRSKAEHKRAIFILGKEISSALTDGEYSGPARMSERLSGMITKMDKTRAR